MTKIYLLAASLLASASLSAAPASFLGHNTSQPEPRKEAPSRLTKAADSPAREASEAPLLHLGYLGNDAYVYAYDGLQVDQAMTLGVAVKLNSEVLAPYVGTRIMKLRFGWSNPDHTGTAHWTVRRTMEGEPLAQGDCTLSFSFSDPWDKAGWNTVDLDTPIEITDDMDELWLGYDVNMEANEYSIPTLVYGTYVENTQFVKHPEEGWMDISLDYGPMYLEALALDNRQDVVPSMKVLRMTNQPMTLLDGTTPADVWVTNNGTRDITKVDLHYALEGSDKETTLTMNFSGSGLTPGQNAVMGVDLPALGTGHHIMTVTALNDHQLTGELPTLEYDMVAVPAEVAAQYSRKGLVEFFCSENDYNSQRYYDEMIVPGLIGYDNKMVLLCQHCNDKLMPEGDPGTQLMLDFVDGNENLVYVPMMAIDRAWYPGTGDSLYPDSPVQWTLYPRFAQMMYNLSCRVPAFASVSVDSSLGDDGRQYTVNAHGTVSGGVLPEGEPLFLTVYMVENGIESLSQDLPDDYWTDDNYPDHKVVHDNVVRQQLTPLYGDMIEASGDYSKQYTATLPEDAVADNVYFVAMVNRGLENDRWNRNVVNVACAPLGEAGLKGITADKDASAARFVVTPAGTITTVEGSVPTSVTDMAGRSLDPASSLAPGVYVARSGSAAAKVLVK